jgi:phosphoglycerate dehydrogenase-like enzyme
VVLTPHIAGWSPEAISASVRQFLRNCEEHSPQPSRCGLSGRRATADASFLP